MKLIFLHEVDLSALKLPANWYYDFDGDAQAFQSSQNSKFAIKIKVSTSWHYRFDGSGQTCDTIHSDILWGSSPVYCYLFSPKCLGYQ